MQLWVWESEWNQEICTNTQPYRSLRTREQRSLTENITNKDTHFQWPITSKHWNTRATRSQKSIFLCDMSVVCNALVLHLISFTEKAEPHVPACLCCASSSGLMLQKMWTMYVMHGLNKWVQTKDYSSSISTCNT